MASDVTIGQALDRFWQALGGLGSEWNRASHRFVDSVQPLGFAAEAPADADAGHGATNE
jgi:hypothetical protein